MKLSKADLRDKIYGAWVGKNIGGTIGTPYENTRDILEVQGFSSQKGEPLPNDDLGLPVSRTSGKGHSLRLRGCLRGSRIWGGHVFRHIRSQ